MIENECFFYTEALKGEPLLQSEKLVKAEEITRPKSLLDKQLLPLWFLGKSFLQGNPNFIAVAFTQFREESIKIVNGNPLLRRIIFFPQIFANFSDSYRDCLLINPEISIPSEVDYYASVEGCGSIEFARLGMVVRRPYSMLLKTYVWRPGEKVFMGSMLLEDIDAGVMEHEYIHLEGKDATFYPEDILDFTDPKHEGWNNRDETQKMVAREIRKIALGNNTEKYKGWLIHKEGKFIIVNSYGKYIRDFKS